MLEHVLVYTGLAALIYLSAELWGIMGIDVVSEDLENGETTVAEAIKNLRRFRYLPLTRGNIKKVISSLQQYKD